MPSGTVCYVLDTDFFAGSSTVLLDFLDGHLSVDSDLPETHSCVIWPTCLNVHDVRWMICQWVLHIIWLCAGFCLRFCSQSSFHHPMMVEFVFMFCCAFPGCVIQACQFSSALTLGSIAQVCAVPSQIVIVAILVMFVRHSWSSQISLSNDDACGKTNISWQGGGRVVFTDVFVSWYNLGSFPLVAVPHWKWFNFHNGTTTLPFQTKSACR